jgi:hypothetical protein
MNFYGQVEMDLLGADEKQLQLQFASFLRCRIGNDG